MISTVFISAPPQCWPRSPGRKWLEDYAVEEPDGGWLVITVIVKFFGGGGG
jgi:hypothetical protein